MTSTLFDPDSGGDASRDDERSLRNVVDVQFRINHLKIRADARQLQLMPDDQVIVDAQHGPTIAVVTDHVERALVDDSELPPILRKASENDLARAAQNEEVEEKAYRFGLQCIQERDLPMKLVRTQCMQDGSKLLFFFTADGRIDFRDLVRDLARKFRTRIEMRQIGVRDGAQMIGGIGPCGRELCCSTFLDHFEPISIRMAKDQGLTLNPAKISGMCGRLMCCLVYEQKIYRRLKTKIPAAGQQVLTEAGPGEIRHVDVVNRQVTVVFSDDTQKQILALDELQLIGDGQIPETVDAEAEGDGDSEKLWDGDPPRKKSSD